MSKGIDFQHIIWRDDEEDTLPTHADVMYILNAFVEAVQQRGLVTGGGAKEVEMDYDKMDDETKERYGSV